eukprot:4637007-Amphidinium_carterae.1
MGCRFGGCLLSCRMRRERAQMDGMDDCVGQGLLRKTMYGTVDASARWQAHYVKHLGKHGCVQGLSNLALLHHVAKDVR